MADLAGARRHATALKAAGVVLAVLIVVVVLYAIPVAGGSLLPIAFEDARLSADGRSVEVMLLGPRAPLSPDDGCGADYAGEARAVGNVLEVRVATVQPSPRPLLLALPHLMFGSVAFCDAVGYFRTVSVPVPPGFSGTTVRDRTSGATFPIPTPAQP